MNPTPTDQEALFSPEEIAAIEFALNYAEGHNYTIAKEAYIAAARQYACKEGWISVEERPLFTKDEKGNWTCTVDGDKEFLAAISYTDKRQPGKDLWWIRHCVVADSLGLCVVGDDDNEPAGWQLEDVLFWQPIPAPPSPLPVEQVSSEPDFPYNYHSEPLKNHVGHVTYEGEPSQETRDAVNAMADIAFNKIRRQPAAEPPVREEDEEDKMMRMYMAGEHNSGIGICKKKVVELQASLAAANEKIKQLEYWKESAISVSPPLQEIGKALGLRLGTSIHDKILPGIIAANEKIAHLEAQNKELRKQLKGKP